MFIKGFIQDYERMEYHRLLPALAIEGIARMERKFEGIVLSIYSIISVDDIFA
jgi:hypothetical protein